MSGRCRYPIADASYKLTESRESPILGHNALREVGLAWIAPWDNRIPRAFGRR